MNKKLLFSVIAIILAVITIAVGVLLIVKNIGDCQISIEKNTALAGDTVSIPIVIEKNSGIWGGQVIIDYDAKNLTFESATNGDVFDECQVNDTGESVVLLLNQVDLKDSKINGLVATLNFKVKTSSDDGELKISFNKESNFCNAKEKMIEPILKDGAIIVK